MAEDRPPVDAGRFPSPSMYRLSLAALGIYFSIRLLYFAFVIPHEIPPDELIHLELVEHFADSFLLPGTDLPLDRAHLRLAPYQPYLYYLVAGKWVSGNVFPMSDLMFIRLLTVAFACLTVYYGWRFISVLSNEPLVHLVFLTMMTNTLMFSFISASVTYDSLANLFAAMAIYHLTDLVINRSAASLPYMGLALALGCLTKITMLPLAFALVACLLLLERKKFGLAKESLGSFWGSLRAIQRAWAIVALIAIILNGMLYGNNLSKFGHLVPKPKQLLNEEELLLNPVYARNWIYLDYMAGELDLEKALEYSKRIKNQPVALSTFQGIQRLAWHEKNGIVFEPLSRVGYVKPWYVRMLRSTYGIHGHEVLSRSPSGLLPYTLVFVLTLCFVGLRTLQKKIPVIDFALMGMAVFYMILIMQYTNYTSYRAFQEIHITIHGRYLFLLLLPIYGMIAKYLLSVSSHRLRATIAAALVVLFVYGDFVFYVREWG